MSESVKKTQESEAVRFVYDITMPEDLLDLLTKKLNISKKDTIRGGGKYHNFKDFMEFSPDRAVQPEYLLSTAPASATCSRKSACLT